MKNIFLLIFLFFLFFHQFSLNAQILEFDQLEMRYDQKQYKAVYKNALKLLDKPEYDFSYIPQYYLALSKLQLIQDKRWFKRNKYALDEAVETFKDLNRTKEGKAILQAHQYELSILKNDLSLWMNLLYEDGEKDLFLKIKNVIEELFPDVKDVSKMKEDHIVIDGEISVPTDGDKRIESTKVSSSTRSNIIQVSESVLGVPYKWAGKTPDGFDCSGFTCYVYSQAADIQLSHRSGDQFKETKKLKREEVQQGDFVFFGNGNRISHVGIVYSTNNESIQMIHASSSVGISVIDIYESDYWRKRIKGFGTILEN
ncbi:MAG: C40 family peptidase [Brumimicrobium sp.]